MGITKLMHMKESSPTPHTHLRNAIDYILNEEKTKNGELVGGNSGLERKEILQSFLETKRFYGKMDGRQGYHFVISFAAGETDEATAYQIMQEFCEEYLGENYDFAFAVHNDKAHLHGHIIFNSVSRITGAKYHYKKGDWEKYIQPVTDKLCKAHGLSPLVFEDETVGESYAAWVSKKDKGYNWKDIIRADIDVAIRRAASYPAFKDLLKQMGYTLGREGIIKGQEYLSLKAEGMIRAWRTTSLGELYSLQSIKRRILTKEAPHSDVEITKQMERVASPYLQSGMLKGTPSFRRLYQTVNYYQLPNPFAVPAYRVRKDMLQLERLVDECRYIKENGLITGEQMKKRLQMVRDKLRELQTERKSLYGILQKMRPEEKDAQQKYISIWRQLQKQEQLSDARIEELEDKMETFEQQYPREVLLLPTSLDRYKVQIAALRKEERMLQRLLDEKGMSQTMEPKQPT